MSGTFGNKRRAFSHSIVKKKIVPDEHTRISLVQRAINYQLEHDVYVVNVGGARTMDW